MARTHDTGKQAVVIKSSELQENQQNSLAVAALESNVPLLLPMWKPIHGVLVAKWKTTITTITTSSYITNNEWHQQQVIQTSVSA